ncbi:MAG TPA: sugar ABC transporter permease [Streptosporangiaceae bacterium]|jgi:multiple sugar transport system permease protein
MAVAIRGKARKTRARGAAGAGGTDPGAKSRRDRWANRDRTAAAGLLAPNLVLFTVFIIIPVILALALSFTSWDLVGAPQWIGLGNYRQMLADPAVPQAIETTMIFLVLGVVPTVVLGLLLALLANIQFRFVAVVRTLYFVPAVVSFAASAVLWQWIYRPGQGILDFLLYKVGITGPAWLSNTHTALPALDIISIWLSLPIAILLYLAALQRIPPQIIEAATLDGAGAFSRLRNIIWPGVRSMTILVVIVTILAFTNSSFDLVNILTQGGPINATTTLIYYIYYAAFNNLQLGYAAALSVLQLMLFAAILALLAGARRVAR